jgi:hypothetical protein
MGHGYNVFQIIINVGGPNSDSLPLMKNSILKKAVKMNFLEWKKCCSTLSVNDGLIILFYVIVIHKLSVRTFIYRYVRNGCKNVCSHAVLMLVRH